MKSKLLLIYFFVISTVSAQSYDLTTVYRGKGTAIEAEILSSGDLSPSDKASIRNTYAAAYPNITILDDATYTYNCHGFA